MRFAPLLTVPLGAISITVGSFLILVGTIQSVGNSFGLMGLLPFALIGGLLTFVSLPIALFGFDSLPDWMTGLSKPPSGEISSEDESWPLFSNKRIMGLSFVITGVVWTIFTLIGLWAGALFTMCPYNGCRSIFSNVGSWILIAIGLSMLAIGIALVAMSLSRNCETQMRKSEGNELQISNAL